MGEPVVEKITNLGDGVTETTVIEVVGEPTAEDIATIERLKKSAGFQGVVAPPLPTADTAGVGEFFGEYVNSPGTELVKQYKLYGDAFPSGVGKQKSAQAAEFAAAQAAAITKNAERYDDAVYNLTREYNLARIERLEAKAAFERESESQANAFQRQRVQVQIQSIDRQAAESDRQFKLQLEGLENQRSDFERSNSTSADPFRALGAGAVGANSPLAAYAKQVMDLGIASDKEKLRINERAAAEQEAARQGALRAQDQQALIDLAEIATRETNAQLAHIQGFGRDAIDAVLNGMALEDLGLYFTELEQKIRIGTNEVTGEAIFGYASEQETHSGATGGTGSAVDDASVGALAFAENNPKKEYVPDMRTTRGKWVDPGPPVPKDNDFDGLTAAAPAETTVTDQGSGLFE